jgi:hypothetical protein
MTAALGKHLDIPLALFTAHSSGMAAIHVLGGPGLHVELVAVHGANRKSALVQGPAGKAAALRMGAERVEAKDFAPYPAELDLTAVRAHIPHLTRARIAF